MFSGQIIDDEQDLGYGPAHYLTPEQVADINSQISKITVQELKQRYDPAKMTELEVYPNIWEDEGEETFEYLSDNFSMVQQLYSDATKNGQAIISIMS